MNEQFLNLAGLRENPFHVSPNPRFYYSTPAHDTALAELMYGIETRRGLLVLTGEAGTGKTSILNQILDWLRHRGRSTAFIFHTRVEPIGLLRLILADFGLPCESKSKSDLIRTLHHWLLQRHAVNDVPVLILDEAQALPPQTLDEIRLILNAETSVGKLLQIILSGQPELEENLRLRALRQRIMFHSRLSALTEKQTAAYIARRLAVAGCADTSAFPQEVVQSIYAISQGIPRVVNLLCENALICAYGEQCRVISPEMIQRIGMDFDLCSKYLATTADETQPQHPYGAPPLLITERGEVAEAPPTAVDGREAVPVLARVAVAAANAAASPARTVPVAAAIPIPVTPVAVPFARVARRGATPETPARPRTYWRRHRTRTAVAEFTRNSVSTVKQARETVWGMLVEWVGRVHRTLFPMVEKSQPVSAAKEPSKEECWTPIEFDVLEKMHPRAQKQAQTTAKEDRTSAGAPAMPVRSRTYWGKYQLNSTMAVYARNSMSSVKGMWSAMSGPVVVYFRSVVDSFIRDFHHLRRDSPVRTPATEVSASVDGNNGKSRSTAYRCTLALVQWLRQPMSPPRASVDGSNGKSRSTAHRCKLALVQWLRQPMSPPRASSRARRRYVSASGDNEAAETEN